MGSSDLDAHTLGSRGAPGNQLSCSLPSGANRPIVGTACIARTRSGLAKRGSRQIPIHAEQGARHQSPVELDQA